MALGERREHVVHLERELAGGHEHEAAGLAGLGLVESLEERQAEGERLAGAGLGLAAHVAPGERVGDRQALDGEGFDDALVGEDLDEAGGDAEGLEGEVVLLGGGGGGRDVGVVHDVRDNDTGGAW